MMSTHFPDELCSHGPVVYESQNREYTFCLQSMKKMIRIQIYMVGVAQQVEHWVVAPAVAGSNPVTHPIKYAITLGELSTPFFVLIPAF